MIDFHLLGTTRMFDRDEGRSIDAILTQPKRLAFFAYLAVAGRLGPLRRDTLLAVFWPESSEERARNSLNQMIFALRKAVGGDAVVARGNGEVGLDPERVWCDVAAFEDALGAGDLVRALEVYGGDLLPGLHISGSLEFESWLGAERERLRRRAVEAAISLAEKETDANPVDAVHRLRRAADWDPYDERVLRRLTLLLDALGDRSGATREYESFRERLKTDLELDPSPETQALVGEIRARKEATGEELEPPVTVTRPVLRWIPTGRRQRRAAIFIGLAAGISLAAAAAWLQGSGEGPPRGPLDEKRVLVGAFENRTGDPVLDPIGLMAGDWIAQGLARSGIVRVVPFSTVIREALYLEKDGRNRDAEPSDRTLARDVGAGVLVSGAFYARGDSLVFQSRIVDVATGEVLRAIDEVSGSARNPNAAVGELRRRALGSIAALMDERLASWADPSDQPPSLEAYRLFSEGFDLFLQANEYHGVGGDFAARNRLNREAAGRFVQAAGEDSAYTAPLLWAVFAYSNGGEPASRDSLIEALERRGGFSTWERNVLELQRAHAERDSERAYRVALDLVELAPESEWLFKLGMAAYDTRRFREAIEAFERLDPDRGWISGFTSYWHFRIEARHALGDHARELEDVGRLRARFPDDPDLLRLEMNALAALGRADPLLARIEAGRVTGDERMLRWLDWVVEELEAHGHPALADRVLERALSLQMSRSTGESGAGFNDSRAARLLYLAGRWEEAGRLWERLAAENPEALGYRARLGVLAARKGDRVEAERVDRWLQGIAPAVFDLRGGSLVWRARIAIHLGRRDRALGLLRQALEGGLRHGHLLLHADADLEPLRGDPAFQALIQPRG